MTRLETLQQDAELIQEMDRRLKSGAAFPNATRMGASNNDLKNFIEGFPTDQPSSSMEAVILDFLRPCLLVKNNSFSLPDSDIWKSRLEPYRKLIERRLPSVGRIEFKFHPRFKWGGTGWLIAENIIITNRHVASLFAGKSGNNIIFNRNSLGLTIEASIDYNEEFQTVFAPLQVGVEEVLYLADDGQPDIAILKLSPGGSVLEPVPIYMGNLVPKSEIAVIGYPAYDPYRNPLKPADVTRIFGDIFDFKRMSPGLLLNEEAAPNVFSHDATTLGGNSGSLVLDLKTGHAAGLHFSGVFHDENFAVTGRAILDALAKTSVHVVNAKPPVSVPAPVDSENSFQEEAPVEQYNDRVGYIEEFLGDGAVIPLPQISDKENILTFGNDEFVLKYLHFSVVMNKARRMCFYSAVNIHGAQSRKTKRPGWRLDPRIKKEFQIMGECYGNPPKFSRGHMTRREDPAWGGDLQEATLGNADSMHVTNTVPQMQPFNGGIWLGLEDYALQNARGDEMMISVFTGPFFTGEDPERFDIQIPLEFWKIIAFIHDETGELCATGYTMSQETFLAPEEFVFGEYKTYQTTIRSIEERAGIKFGELADLDPYVNEEVVASPLQDFSQVRFRR